MSAKCQKQTLVRAFLSAMSGSYAIGLPPTTIWVVINLSSAVRNSASTLCSDIISGTGGWAAVIGLIRQIHSYERSPDLRRPKARRGREIRLVFQGNCKPLLTFASRNEDASRSSYAIQGGLRLPLSSRNPENGAPGSLQRTADL